MVGFSIPGDESIPYIDPEIILVAKRMAQTPLLHNHLDLETNLFILFF
jgi:hypothetical protein